LVETRLSVEDIEKSVWPQLLDRRLDKVIVNLVKEEYEPSAEDIIYKPLASGSFVLALKLPGTTIEIDEVLVSDYLAEELQVQILYPRKGLWKFVDEDRVRESE